MTPADYQDDPALVALVDAAREMVAAEKAYPADSASVPAKMAALTRIDRARERLESTLAPFDEEETD